MTEEERMFLHGRIRRSLENLRAGCSDQRLDLNQLLADVGGLDKSPVDFGVSEEEVCGFFRASCREEAKNWLWYLRRMGSGGNDFEQVLRLELLRGGFSLADISTSEEELVRLRERSPEPEKSSAAAIKLLDDTTRQFDAMLEKWLEE